MLYKKLLESNLTDLQVANLKLIEAGQSHKFLNITDVKKRD